MENDSNAVRRGMGWNGRRGTGVMRDGVLRGSGCRIFRLRRDKAGLAKGDLLMVVPGAIPEGGEFVVDLKGRVGRHGGGPVMGVIVGVVKERS